MKLMKKNEVHAGVILSYIQIFVTFIGTFLFTPILLSGLGQQEYGLYQLIGSFVGYLAILDLGFSAAIIRYVAKYQAEDDKKGQENFLAMCLIIYGLLSILIVAVGFVLYGNIEIIFKNSLSTVEISKAKQMFLMLIFSTAFTIIGNVFTGALSGHERYVFQKYVGIAKSFLNLAFGALIVFLGAKSVELTGVNVFFNTMAFVVYAWYAICKEKIRFKLYYFDKPLLKETFYFSFFVFLQGIMGQVYYKLGDFILGVMTNTSVVAIYAIAMQMNSMLLCFVGAIAGVLLPKAAKLVAEGADGDRLTDFMIYSGRLILIVYAFITSGFMLLGKSFLQLWAGSTYTEAYHIVLIVAIASLASRIQTSGNDIARAYNKHAFLTVLYFGVALLNVAVSIFLVKLWGITGAAIGTGFTLIVGNTIIANIYYHRVFKINVLRFFRECFKGILPAIMLSVFVGITISKIIPGEGLLLFVGRGIIFVVVYALFMITIGINKTERKLVYSLLRGVET